MSQACGVSPVQLGTFSTAVQKCWLCFVMAPTMCWHAVEHGVTPTHLGTTVPDSIILLSLFCSYRTLAMQSQQSSCAFTRGSVSHLVYGQLPADMEWAHHSLYTRHSACAWCATGCVVWCAVVVCHNRVPQPGYGPTPSVACFTAECKSASLKRKLLLTDGDRTAPWSAVLRTCACPQR